MLGDAALFELAEKQKSAARSLQNSNAERFSASRSALRQFNCESLIDLWFQRGLPSGAGGPL